jgi:hypothetical protein
MHVIIVAALGVAPTAQSDHGFHWSDAAIGATAGFGLALAAVGVVSLLRVPRRPAGRRRDVNR